MRAGVGSRGMLFLLIWYLLNQRASRRNISAPTQGLFSTSSAASSPQATGLLALDLGPTSQ